nr:hypothetical protein [Micromonospora sp. DSM 115978]
MTDRAEQSDEPPDQASPPAPWRPADQAGAGWAGADQAGAGWAAPERPTGARWSRWLIIGTVGWAVLLVGLTYLSTRLDEPTVREQRSLSQAVPVVSRAIGELVVAAAPDAVVELSPARLATSCRITPLRAGATLERDVVLRTTPDQVAALVDRIADRLPAGYRAGVRPDRDGSGPTLRADAGEFVTVTGELTGPGELTVTAATGCRPTDPDLALAETLPGLPVDEEPGRLLAALGATEVSPVERTSALCPAGGAAYTVSATGAGGPAAPPPAQTLPEPGGLVAVADLDRYAYRDGPRSVVIDSADGDLRVAVTTDCA